MAGRSRRVSLSSATRICRLLTLDRLSLFINLGIVTLSTFALVFSPFLLSPTALFQAIHRIFPFARGLFEDKVANFWCALNIVIKLRDLASVSTLAKLALVATLGAVLPGVAGMLWVSWESGRRRREAAVGGLEQTEDELAESTPPTQILLPHSLFVSSMAFFLFSFQVHEKSILLPLMPLTMLMGGREAGYGRMDWEWAVLTNNVGVFRSVVFLPVSPLADVHVACGLCSSAMGWDWSTSF